MKPQPTIGALLILSCLIGLGAQSGDKVQKLTIQDIILSWEKQEARLEKMVCEWVDQVTVPKGTLLFQASGNRKELEKDLVYDVVNLIKFHGLRWRVESKGMVFNPQGELVPQKETAVLSGGYLKSYMPPGTSRGVANISKAAIPKVPQAINMKAPFMLFRPIGLKSINSADLKTTLEKDSIRDIPCVILENTRDHPTLTKIWVAPNLDYSILRYANQENGVTVSKIDVQYKLEKDIGWVPFQWKTVSAGGNGIVNSIWSKVTRFDVGKDVSGQDFHLQIPDGTLVRDFTKDPDSLEFTQHVAGKEGGLGVWFWFSISLFFLILAIIAIMLRRKVAFFKGGRKNV